MTFIMALSICYETEETQTRCLAFFAHFAFFTFGTQTVKHCR